MRLRPLLDLVRIPLAPTAIVDSLAGYFIALSVSATAVERATAAAGSLSPPRLALACAVSVLLYCFGMATNDIFDRAKDERFGATRPLVSGELSRATAIGASLALVACGLGVALALGVWPVALALVAAILLYNGGGKRVPLVGNALMGSCRSFNFLLGTAAGLSPALRVGELIETLLTPELLLPAALLGAYIASVTAISLLEDRPYRRRPLQLLIAVQLLFPIGFAAWSWNEAGAWVNSALLALMLARELRLPPDGGPAGASGSPHPAEKAVRGGLRGIYLVDAALLWKHGLAAPACGAYALLVFGWFCMRWWIESLREPRPSRPEQSS